MLKIPYSATNFAESFTKLKATGHIDVTWAKLVWSAITVGKAAGDEYAYGSYSAHERRFRASMLRACLFRGSSGSLFQTLPYEASDPSEKTAVSFYLGMTLAKLFAEVIFDLPRLLHVAVYGAVHQVTAGKGYSRPDLIGLSSNGEWFVFEAKGRSNGFDSAALGVAKKQAKQIKSIDKQLPLCRIASQSFFTKSGLQFRMDDPEPDVTSSSRVIEIGREEFARAYYSPIRSMVETGRTDGRFRIGDSGFFETRIEEADIWIGITEPGEAQQGWSVRTPLPLNEYLGNDGVFVRLGPSWSEENMSLQPHLRRT